MAQLKDKIQNALDEGRMLVLGAQVLLGFQFRSIFEPGFDKLPQASQYLKLCGLTLLLLVIALLITPGAHHRIVEEGEDTERQHRFTTVIVDWALLPFALAIGIDLYVAFRQTLGQTGGFIAGLAGTLFALFFWYGLEFIRKSAHRHESKGKDEEMAEQEKSEGESGGSKIKDKIKHVLTEARVVLPGAQALLGFQLITMFTDAFEKLPVASKYVHLSSLSLVGVSIVLLMTPAAYHRIVEEGEETEHFHRFASRVLIAAMIPLALGICGDFFVVLRKVIVSSTYSLIAAALMLVVFYSLWFGLTIYRRKHPAHSDEERISHRGHREHGAKQITIL
jgi:amino acid permease